MAIGENNVPYMAFKQDEESNAVPPTGPSLQPIQLQIEGSKFASKQAFRLGVLQIIFGLLASVMEIVFIVCVVLISYERQIISIGIGFWTGLSFCIAGVLGIVASRNNQVVRVRIIVSFMVMSIIACVCALILIFCSIQYAAQGTVVVSSIMVAIGVAEAVVSIWSSAICCAQVCCGRRGYRPSVPVHAGVGQVGNFSNLPPGTTAYQMSASGQLQGQVNPQISFQPAQSQGYAYQGYVQPYPAQQGYPMSGQQYGQTNFPAQSQPTYQGNAPPVQSYPAGQGYPTQSYPAPAVSQQQGIPTPGLNIQESPDQAQEQHPQPKPPTGAETTPEQVPSLPPMNNER